MYDIIIYVIISICIILMTHNIFNFFVKTTTTPIVIDPIADIKDTYNNIHMELCNKNKNIEEEQDDKNELMDFVKSINSKNKPDLFTSIQKHINEGEDNSLKLLSSIHEQYAE
jgi:hypothetical protein